MLSYRHAFHSGNHADVLKHLVLVQLMRYLAQKDKPFWVIDTHAGAGLYELTTGYATKLAEFASGIGKLWHCPALPPALADYVGLVAAANPPGQLLRYPGSPWLAQHLLRAQDRLRLFELHPSDAKLLQHNCAGDKRVVIAAGDGLAGLKALLPPPPRRGLILIDPAYELRDEYRHVLQALRTQMPRFSTGIYAVWYPQLTQAEAMQFPDKLKTLAQRNWLHVALTVRARGDAGLGMHGSGMFIFNPPWTLHETLQDVMPVLVRLLGQDAAAHFTLEQDLP